MTRLPQDNSEMASTRASHPVGSLPCNATNVVLTDHHDSRYLIRTRGITQRHQRTSRCEHRRCQRTLIRGSHCGSLAQGSASSFHPSGRLHHRNATQLHKSFRSQPLPFCQRGRLQLSSLAADSPFAVLVTHQKRIKDLRTWH